MAPDRVELPSWEWERGKASHSVYLDHALIIRHFRFSLCIRFLHHFALMIKLKEGLFVSLYSGRSREGYGFNSKIGIINTHIEFNRMDNCNNNTKTITASFYCKSIKHWFTYLEQLSPFSSVKLEKLVTYIIYYT